MRLLLASAIAVTAAILLLGGGAGLAAGPAVAATTRAAACPGANVVPTAATLTRARSAVLCLLNKERTSRGRRKLSENRALLLAARGHSVDMTRRHYFDHNTPEGVTPATRIVRKGYPRGGSGWTVGENIAWGGGPYATPASTVREWMHSPPHRANILLGRYRSIGIGIALGTPESASGATYTTDFGSR